MQLGLVLLSGYDGHIILFGTRAAQRRSRGGRPRPENPHLVPWCFMCFYDFLYFLSKRNLHLYYGSPNDVVMCEHSTDCKFETLHSNKISSAWSRWSPGWTVDIILCFSPFFTYCQAPIFLDEQIWTDMNSCNSLEFHSLDAHPIHSQRPLWTSGGGLKLLATARVHHHQCLLNNMAEAFLVASGSWNQFRVV